MMQTMIRLLAVLFCLAQSSIAQPHADLIINSAKVWTVDASIPWAQAVAILNDRIVEVGSNKAIARWKGKGTQVIDAAGKLVLPGFNDAHLHFISGGRSLDEISLNDAVSSDDFVARIAAKAKEMSTSEWITGGRWDETKWADSLLPSAALIDGATKDIPALLSRTDGHLALANSAALKAAGINAKTPEVAGGVIERDKQGNPTGILKDAAIDLVHHVMPQATREQFMRAARKAMEHAASLGVTSVQEMSASYESISVYAELAQRGELITRIYAAPLESGERGDWHDQAQVGLRRAFGSSFLRLGAVKGFADGSAGARTAAFFEPYSDDRTNKGLLTGEVQSGMARRLLDADAAGLQLCVHGIGDRGVSEALDIFESIVAKRGKQDQRFRVEHAQHIAEKDFARFANLSVIASMQPYHMIDDGRWIEQRIGHDRVKRSYAWRTLLDRKVKLAFGTDWNVVPLNPMLGLYAAVTRATLDGKNPNGWVPEQRLTIEEAIEAYTLGSAFAEFQEHEKGSITKGKLADLIILDADLFEIAPEKIREVRVLKTIVGGKVVYARP